jgi:hypothetical protein
VSTLHDRLDALVSSQAFERARLETGSWRPESGLRLETMLHAVLGALTLGSSTVLVWSFLTAGFGA